MLHSIVSKPEPNVEPTHEIFLPAVIHHETISSQPKTINSKFLDYQNKCRCCFDEFRISAMKIMMTRNQRNAFKRLTGVELVQDPRYSRFMCQKCFADITKCHSFIEKSRKLQKEFQEFVKTKPEIKTEEVLISAPETETVTLIIDKVSHPPPAIIEIKKEPPDCNMECSVKLERVDLDNVDVVQNLISATGTKRISKPVIVPTVINIKIQPKRPKAIPRDHLTGENRRMFCDKCDWSSLDRGMMMNHAIRHVESCKKKIIFRCKLCGKKCASSVGLACHMKSMHKKSSSFPIQCPICKLGSTSNYRLEIHMYWKHPCAEKKFNCKKCAKGFFTHEVFVRHMNLKHYAKVKCKEKTCKRLFMRRSEMMVHYRAYHVRASQVRKLNIPCEVCGKTFSTKSYLQLHLKSHDLERQEEVHKCETCGVEYATFKSLRVHRIRHIKPAPDIKCKTCDAMFYTEFQCRDHHKKSHEEAPKLPCEYCGKMFRGNSNLISHVKYVHQKIIYDKTIPCPKCDRIFTTKGRLTIHMKQNHDEERQCDVCGEKFFSLVRLQRHQFAKHQSLRYRCLVPGCVREYTDKQKIAKHLKLHHKELSAEEQAHYEELRKKMQPT